MITRELVRANRDKTFLFGDNLQHRGMGGQAKEMRHEWNAIGIPTKKRPDNHPTSFFTDAEYFTNVEFIESALAEIPSQTIIVISVSGIGTGLARLPEVAPQTYQYLLNRLADLDG